MAVPGVDITLITSIYGGYDQLRHLPDGHGFADAVCVTDGTANVAVGWRHHLARGKEPARLAAKRPKMLPFDFVDCDVALWLDASAQIVDGRFFEFAADALQHFDIVVWDHPERRTCLFQEAAYCQDWEANRRMPLRAQTAHYRAAGMPERFGLWAAGAVLWRNTPDALKFGRAWLAENERWSTRDQVSLPFLVWRDRPNLGTFPADQKNNPYLRWGTHLPVR
jgi:hypothetical protein